MPASGRWRGIVTVLPGGGEKSCPIFHGFLWKLPPHAMVDTVTIFWKTFIFVILSVLATGFMATRG